LSDEEEKQQLIQLLEKIKQIQPNQDNNNIIDTIESEQFSDNYNIDDSNIHSEINNIIDDVFSEENNKNENIRIDNSDNQNKNNLDNSDNQNKNYSDIPEVEETENQSIDVDDYNNYESIDNFELSYSMIENEFENEEKKEYDFPTLFSENVRSNSQNSNNDFKMENNQSRSRSNMRSFIRRNSEPILEDMQSSLQRLLNIPEKEINNMESQQQQQQQQQQQHLRPNEILITKDSLKEILARVNNRNNSM
jgi:hypothetical protein